VTTEITKYKCDFCKREYSKNRRAAYHESMCYHNPARRACVNCAHFTKNGVCAVNAHKMDYTYPENHFVFWSGCLEWKQKLAKFAKTLDNGNKKS
jgi:late competence protein required for DNA uptake (superfamily II DNA/RNA helicase)